MGASRCRCFWLFVLAWSLSLASAGERLLVGKDGSLSGPLPSGTNGVLPAVIQFGLPAIAPERLWREGPVLRGLWVTNGIRYTQTVFLTEVFDASDAPASGRNPVPVLLVNIEGENTNSEYTDATAQLAMERDGKRQELELKQGQIWRLDGTGSTAFAALEIPPSGIKVTRGEALGFAGHMPPSIKGSMTIKIPLDHLSPSQAADPLADLEFETELYRALKRPAPSLGSPRARWQLSFVHETQGDSADTARP
jgi:hypothetical protein